eukprot:7906301-Pyramimonas_sp.AAC.2
MMWVRWVMMAMQHLVSALNLIYNLRHRGRSDNVLLLTNSQKDCQYLAAQHVVYVRVCTWSDKLSKPRCVGTCPLVC